MNIYGLINTGWLAETRLLLENVTDEIVEDQSDPHPYELSITPYAFKYDPIGHIDWIYVHDLDQLAFTVDDKIHFRLDNLPSAKEWMRYIAKDGSNIKCIAPWTPDKYRGEFVAHPIKPLSDDEQKDLEYYNNLPFGVETIHPSTWLKPAPPNLALQEKVSFLAAEGFMTARYSHITNIQRYLNNPVVFEDLAKDVLTAACHGGSMFTLDEQTARTWTCDVIHNPKAYNRKRIDYYWYRDRLICLVPSLDHTDHFKAEVGIVVRWMKESNLSEVTAILWSIRHVAVLVVSGDKVTHSDPIPVAAALGKGRDKLQEGLKLISHYLPIPIVESDPSFDCRVPLDIIIRIMDVSDYETSAALGQTSKTLRYEWLRHPFFGPYRLFSCQGEHFNATNETGRHVTLRLEPRECLPYLKHNNYGDYPSLGDLTAYRKPLFYVDKFNYWSKYALEVVAFSRIHGYRVFLDPAS